VLVISLPILFIDEGLKWCEREFVLKGQKEKVKAIRAGKKTQ